MSFPKGKLDNQKNERAIAEHGKILTIMMQEEKKNRQRETESLKRKSDKNLPYYWLKFIGVFYCGRKRKVCVT